MQFSLIAACDKERGIGKGGTLPWRLSGELAYFHRVTREVTDPARYNAVIMGRKTWESIPEGRRPLSGRLNCVITRDDTYLLPEGVKKFSSLEECFLAMKQEINLEKIFIIGGGALFQQAINLPECEKIYLTEVDGVFGCDTFFPSIPSEHFISESISTRQEENGVGYFFKVFKRK